MKILTKIIVFLISSYCLLGAQTGLASEPGKLAFMRGGNIWVANSDGSGARQLTRSTKDRYPALSPDGRLVAFTSGMAPDSGYGRVFLIPSQGGQAQPLRSPGFQGGEHPAFSPDGKSLIFVGLSGLKIKKDKGGDLSSATMSVAIADLDGGGVRRIISQPNTMLDTGYVYSNPAFSADGKLIAYQESGSDVSGGFVVMNFRGDKVFRLPRNPEDATPYWRPQFSPDGKKILCYSPATSEDQVDTVYLVDLNAGGKTKVAEGSKPTFVDQGRALVFEKWPRNRWVSTGPEGPDLWRLELTPGAKAQKIITDGLEPAGQ